MGRLLTKEETAALLGGVPESSIDQAIAGRNPLPVVRIGEELRFDEEVALEWARSGGNREGAQVVVASNRAPTHRPRLTGRPSRRFPENRQWWMKY